MNDATDNAKRNRAVQIVLTDKELYEVGVAAALVKMSNREFCTDTVLKRAKALISQFRDGLVDGDTCKNCGTTCPNCNMVKQ